MSNLSDKTLEMAEKIQLQSVEDKISRARVRQCNLPQFKDWDGKYCYDCGDDVPQERLDLGRVRCVPCQMKAERLGRD